MSLEIAGVFGAGALTFITPCVLPLIPIYLALLVGNLGESGGKRRLTAFLSTLLFSLRLIIIFVALGMTATALESSLASYRSEFVLAGGLLIFLFGLKFLGVLRIPWLDRQARVDDSRLRTRFHLLNAFVMGLVFGLGWTPCVGPILGSVLTFTASTTSDLGQGAIYLAAYGLGFTAPMIALSLFVDVAKRLVKRVSPWLPRIERASGALLLVVGLVLIFGEARTPTSLPPSRATPALAAASKRDAIKPPLGEPTSRARMVQFTSRTCSVCRQMIPTVAVVERDCDGRQVDVIKVDVKTDRSMAKHYRVRGVPTFIFLDRQGQETARLIGFQKLAALRQALSTTVGEACAGVGLVPLEPPTCKGTSATKCDS